LKRHGLCLAGAAHFSFGSDAKYMVGTFRIKGRIKGLDPRNILCNNFIEVSEVSVVWPQRSNFAVFMTQLSVIFKK
jgi:hypothetical protein